MELLLCECFSLPRTVQTAHANASHETRAATLHRSRLHLESSRKDVPEDWVKLMVPSLSEARVCTVSQDLLLKMTATCRIQVGGVRV